MSKTSDIVRTGGEGSGGQWSNVRTSFRVFLNNMSEPSLGIIFHEITYILKKITPFLNEWSIFYFPKKCSKLLTVRSFLGEGGGPPRFGQCPKFWTFFRTPSLMRTLIDFLLKCRIGRILVREG